MNRNEEKKNFFKKSNRKFFLKKRPRASVHKKYKKSFKDTLIGFLKSFVYRDSQGRIQISLSNDLPTERQIIIFTKQFRSMIKSGVPMMQSLGALAKNQRSLSFKKALLKIQKNIENGESFSKSLKAFPHIFDDLYIAMVFAGEMSGKLEEVLHKLINYLERSNQIKRRVKSSMSYPFFVILVSLIVISALIIFVVPSFAQQYQETGRDLPQLTQILLKVSSFLGSSWHVLLFSCLALCFSFLYWIRTEKGRRRFDEKILYIPYLGELLKKIAIGRFCATMSSMLSAGVSLLDALEVCSKTSGNKKLETFILHVHKALEQGENLSQPLSQGDLFPELVISMISVGETTGSLDEMLHNVSSFYDEEIELVLQTLLSMLEPFLIVFVGGLIGLIVLALYLPIFDMAGGF